MYLINLQIWLKIVEDSSYKVRVKKASEMFRDQPQSPAERAAFWISHVIKYGADHLRPTGNDLYIWQYLCIDILIFCIAVLASSAFAVYVLIRFSIERMLSQLTTTSKKQN